MYKIGKGISCSVSLDKLMKDFTVEDCKEVLARIKEKKLCPACGGSGGLYMSLGKNHVKDEPCKTCNGSGETQWEREI